MWLLKYFNKITRYIVLISRQDLNTGHQNDDRLLILLFGHSLRSITSRAAIYITSYLCYIVLFYLIAYSSSSLFPAMNASSMAAMQSALLSGFCGQPPVEALRGIGSNGARSPTNISDNSDQCDPSSPEMSISLHPALPGQVSFKHTLNHSHLTLRSHDNGDWQHWLLVLPNFSAFNNWFEKNWQKRYADSTFLLRTQPLGNKSYYKYKLLPSIVHTLF